MDKMAMLAEMMKQKGMAGKGGESDDLDPLYAKAKMQALKDLHSHMGSMIGSDMDAPAMDDMKKVTVAAPDSDALAMGLDKAKDLLGSQDPDMDSDDDSAEEDKEDASMSPEEIDAEIAKLQELKKQKMMKG